MTLELEKLITEIRQDYQIPPYFQDTGLMRYLEEGKARLDFLNPGQSLDDDFPYVVKKLCVLRLPSQSE